MPALPIPFSEIQRAAKIWREALDDGYPIQAGAGGELTAAARTAQVLGCPGNLIRAAQVRLDAAVALGLPVSGWRYVGEELAEATVRRYRQYSEEFRAWEGRAQDRPAGASKPRRARSGENGAAVPPRGGPAPDREPLPSPATPLVDQVAPLLRRGPQTTGQIAAALKVDATTAGLALDLAHARGASIALRGDLWHLDAAPAVGGRVDATQLEILTDENGEVTFAACGDMHLGSKYARLDCLNDYYDQVERRGISFVLNTGNYIDGEAPFNRHDLLVHGLDAQLQYLANEYPQRKGVSTLAITGADHEGWYARREGVDVGRYAQNVMQQAGRGDWFDVGYMEAFIPIVHRATGKSSKLCLMHPGGGSAYALSYAPQKIVEGFDGGDKPSVLLIGHYHKSGYNLVRNVHTAQTGTFQDQTVFMRQKKLSAHLGGCFITLKVDPETGAVIECSYTFRNYFVRDYYNGRWSQHGPAAHAPRSARAE